MRQVHQIDNPFAVFCKASYVIHPPIESSNIFRSVDNLNYTRTILFRPLENPAYAEPQATAKVVGFLCLSKLYFLIDQKNLPLRQVTIVCDALLQSCVTGSRSRLSAGIGECQVQSGTSSSSGGLRRLLQGLAHIWPIYRQWDGTGLGGSGRRIPHFLQWVSSGKLNILQLGHFTGFGLGGLHPPQ